MNADPVADVTRQRELLHDPFSPVCRKIRILLAEKGLEFTTRVIDTTSLGEEFYRLNHAGEVPVLLETDGSVICGSLAITGHIDEVYPAPDFLGSTPWQRAETRRLVDWFERKMVREVTDNIVGEKVTKHDHGLGGPDSTRVRAGMQNIRLHLEYVGYLVDNRNWIAGRELSEADIAAAAQFSCIDYLDCVPWDWNESAKDWYARIKSRPSFRSILADKLRHIRPSSHYQDLDF